MERIDVFDYIDKACATLESSIDKFTRAADKLKEYLENTFGEFDATVAVSSRIKTGGSLKEKILRNCLYKEYEAERLVFEMHDIIGVRLECRFFKDEAFLYSKLVELFDANVGDGYFSPTGKKAIRLKLSVPQPERQKNGFDIYRIDGQVTYAGENYNFELQIKSLVNTFWSEIEHKLIYKNIKLNPADTLLKELLNSIHDSLTGVDHQLNLIFDRMNGNTLENQTSMLENMLTLGLNEVYTAIVKASTGIDVSITAYSEAIVIYLLTGSSYLHDIKGKSLTSAIKAGTQKARAELSGATETGSAEDDVSDDDDNYSGLLISLMEWMHNVDYGSIAIGEKLHLTKPNDETLAPIADVFLAGVNSDFYLNTFFHIYFSLERGTDDEDFADYVDYYYHRIMRNKTQEQTYRTLARLSEIAAHKLPLESTIKMLEGIR